MLSLARKITKAGQVFASFLPSSLDPKVCLEVLQPECFLDRQMTYPYKFDTYPRHILDIDLNMAKIIGVAKRAVFEFQKSSHMQPLEMQPLEWPLFPKTRHLDFRETATASRRQRSYLSNLNLKKFNVPTKPFFSKFSIHAFLAAMPASGCCS